MSASSFTDCQIRCDHPGCLAGLRASELDIMDATAYDARQVLKSRGWQVCVVSPERKRLDFSRSIMADVWLVWFRPGKYGDADITSVAHESRDGAVEWCNEHRKLSGGDPVQWTGDEGVSRVLEDHGKHGMYRTDYFYSLEAVPLRK